jgi:hypothetical protein
MIEDAQVIRLCLRLRKATGLARGLEGRKRRKRKGTMISYPVKSSAQETCGPGTIPFKVLAALLNRLELNCFGSRM